MLHDISAYKTGSYDDPFDELLKDADVIDHSLTDPSKTVKEKEKDRYFILTKELL